MLIGSYNHKVDNKKRLSIPSKWRTIFGESVIITTGLEKSLFVYPQSKWEIIAKEISDKGMYSSDSRNFARFILGNAYELAIDSHGRVLLPDTLVSFAKLSEDVILTGVYDRAEIWDKKTYESMMSQISEDAESTATRLSSI